MSEQKDPLLSEEGGKPKTANYSDLMRRKVELGPKGVTVNGCPFGCPTETLCDLGYCDHLVGFTNEDLGHRPGTATGVFEVCLPADPEDHRRKRRVSGKDREKVRRGDVLVRVTNNYRVYRESGIETLMLERATAPETKPALQPA